MKLAPLIELAGAAICIILGSFVAGTEASVVSLPTARLRALLDELGEQRGIHLARYLADPTPLLTKLLTFRVAALITAAILAANAILSSRAPWWQIATLTGAITLAYSALAELCVTVGRARGRAIVPLALSASRPFELFITPIAAPLVLLGRATQSRVATRHSDESPITTREMEYVVEQAENSGALDKKRGQMLQNVLELEGVTARDVMVPRTKVHAIEVNTRAERALQIVTDEGHSRVPVYRGQIDNVVGVLHVKDLFRALKAYDEDETARVEPTLDSIVRKPPLLVAASQNAVTLLREMQSRRTHLAMIVDEYGAVVGMVTLEDILEELVGDIQDEHDTDEAELIDHGDGKYMVSAAMPINDLGEQLGVEFPDVETYASLGGFLAERAGQVPAVGTVVNWGGLIFTVREGDRRHATKVEIIREGSPASLAPPAQAAD